MQIQLNVSRFFNALDRVRLARSLSWRQVALQIGATPSSFSRMSVGKKPSVDFFLACLHWMQQVKPEWADTEEIRK